MLEAKAVYIYMLASRHRHKQNHACARGEKRTVRTGDRETDGQIASKIELETETEAKRERERESERDRGRLLRVVVTG